MKKDFNVIIVGLGLAATAAAARMTELGVENIAMFGAGPGASRNAMALNLCTNDNPFLDTPLVFAQDVLEVGRHIQNPDQVYEMTARSQDVYELFVRWGATFIHNEDGSLHRRQTCGSSKPRTLHYVAKKSIGAQIVDAAGEKLAEAGVQFFRGYKLVRLLFGEGRVVGVTMKDPEGNNHDYYAPVVMAAWGGVGRMLDGVSDGHDDLEGSPLGLAWQLGAKVVDMEFLEFEPTWFLGPGKIRGAIVTSMLADDQPDHGIAIRNSKGERFLFNVRPEGEAGVPKAVLNRENMLQVAKGLGSSNGGVFADFTGLDHSIYEKYGSKEQNLYTNMLAQGIDLDTTWVEIGPKPHSHSGGLVVDRLYRTTLPGLYAAGEAAGGCQGADRAGGMGGGQASLTGFICGEAIALENFPEDLPENTVPLHEKAGIYEKYIPQAQKIANPVMQPMRNGKDLASAIEKLDEMIACDEVKADDITRATLISMRLMLNGALLREESRGVHNRVEFPQERPEFDHGIVQ